MKWRYEMDGCGWRDDGDDGDGDEMDERWMDMDNGR